MFETIFPLLEVGNAVFIGISTVLDSFNTFSRLLLLKDEDGDDFFLVIRVDTVCSECKKLPEDQHEHCSHLDDTVLPPWKSKTRYKRSKILHTVDTNKGRNARESMGIITDDYNAALITKLVKQTMNIATRRYHKIKRSPSRIYITIDPDGGGRSRLSVISAFVCTTNMEELPGTLVILSIDYRQCNDETEQDDVVKRVIEKLRSNRWLNKVPIILIPENQTGFTHRRMERNFNNHVNCRTFHEYNGTKAGVRKDSTKTKSYVIATNDMLQGGLIKFWDEWFSVHANQHPGGKEHMATSLEEEMLRYCYDDKQKLTGKINGMQDDLYISFGMMCYFALIIESAPCYEQYRIATI